MGHKTREWGERTAVCVGETHKKRERTQRKAFTHSGGHKIRTKFLQVFCTCCCSCLLFLLLLLLLKQHVVCCCIVCHCRSLRRSRSQMGSLFVPALWAPLAATLHADGQEPLTHTTPLTHQGWSELGGIARWKRRNARNGEKSPFYKEKRY